MKLKWFYCGDPEAWLLEGNTPKGQEIAHVWRLYDRWRWEATANGLTTMAEAPSERAAKLAVRRALREAKR